MINIGHASLGGNGKISGDAAGDQTQKEVCVRKWYAKSWQVVLRPISSDIAEKSAKACEAGCANNMIGYDQNQRNTAHTAAQKVGYDLSKIKTPCETDCSAFMTLCAIAGGVTELEYSGNAPTTSTMVDRFVKTGKYQKLTDKKYLNSDAYLRRGDILVQPGHHTVMALENGTQAQATQSSFLRGIDVSEYQKKMDYEQLKKSGVQFAIVKIINKKREADPMYYEHLKGFQSVGIPVDVYNYSYATTVEAANLDALAVLDILNGRKCTVYLDVEDKCQQGIKERLPQIINAYQEKIEAAGCKFAIYSGLSFVKSYLAPYLSILNCHEIWIARYYRGDAQMGLYDALDESKKPVVSGFTLLGWQYTSKGRCDGYNGDLDMSIMYQAPSKQDGNRVLMVGFVTASSLRIRSAPNTNGSILSYLTQGQKVLIYGQDPATGWYNISPRDDESKWISNEYVKIE